MAIDCYIRLEAALYLIGVWEVIYMDLNFKCMLPWILKEQYWEMCRSKCRGGIIWGGGGTPMFQKKEKSENMKYFHACELLK